MRKDNYFILIAGPTGVGKTKFADNIISQAKRPVEIINIDQGQFYTPLNIGTAKPDDIKNQHLFNIINEPKNFTVLEYRNALIERLNNLWSRGVLPIIVGGSGFYIKSIFFPPKSPDSLLGQKQDFSSYKTEELFEQLLSIDKERAENIGPYDRYRIERALAIWQETGQKPSSLKPIFDPVGVCDIYYLNRDRSSLYKKIDARVVQMIQKGWIEEVVDLDKSWYDFLKAKKIIGYSEIIDFIETCKSKNQEDIQELINIISQKSRAYAKRQLTFWRSLYKLLSDQNCKNYIKKIIEIDLSSTEFISIEI